MSILIVDDSRTFRELIEHILRKNGYESLLFAESAKEAYEMLAIDGGEGVSSEVDLILMDIFMPEIDGIEALTRISKAPHLRDIPVIMLTADSNVKTLKSAFDAGARDFITKPPNKLELRARIASALALKRETDSRKAHAEELRVLSEELRVANERLKMLSTTDGLTGIPNRRNFDDYLEKVWGLGTRDERPVSLILMDIDHFKLFNDTHGHKGGDDCLRVVADAIRSVVRRSSDLFARYGGEEFAVIMPDTPLEGAMTLAEEIRASVEGRKVPHGAQGAGEFVTISLGVSSMTPERDLLPASLIENADLGLYRAKKGGRNRVDLSKVESSDLPLLTVEPE